MNVFRGYSFFLQLFHDMVTLMISFTDFIQHVILEDSTLLGVILCIPLYSIKIKNFCL